MVFDEKITLIDRYCIQLIPDEISVITEKVLVRHHDFVNPCNLVDVPRIISGDIDTLIPNSESLIHVISNFYSGTIHRHSIYLFI